MTKRGKIIITSLLVISIAFLVGYVIFQPSPGTLSRQQKADVVAAYNRYWKDGIEKEITYDPVIWYDENGGVEEDGVWRYFGTYGDCLVLFELGENFDAELDGLTRPVYYPSDGCIVGCRVVLFHTGEDYHMLYDIPCRLQTLHQVCIEDANWLTDEQLEQLTDDLETWIAEGKK